MRKAVLDSTVLVSAFLNKNGISYRLLTLASAGVFAICLSEDILSEVERVLAYPRLRKKTQYNDEDAKKYVELLRKVGRMVTSQQNEFMVV